MDSNNLICWYSNNSGQVQVDYTKKERKQD